MFYFQISDYIINNMKDIILNLIKDEQEAVAGYVEAIAQIDCDRVKVILQHINDEELKHIKELTDILETQYEEEL